MLQREREGDSLQRHYGGGYPSNLGLGTSKGLA